MGSRPLPPSLPKSPFPRPSPQVTPAAPGVRQGHAETFVQTALHLTTGRSGCCSVRGAPQAPGTAGPPAGKGGGAKRPLNFLYSQRVTIPTYGELASRNVPGVMPFLFGRHVASIAATLECTPAL